MILILCLVMCNFNDYFLLFRDGQLKRNKPKKEWREKQQEELSKRLKVE